MGSTSTTTRADRAARVRSNCTELMEEARNGDVKDVKQVLHMFDALAGEVAKLAAVVEHLCRIYGHLSAMGVIGDDDV